MEKIPIGEFIRESRKAQGLTQEKLCVDICSRESLSRIERGEWLPSNQVLHMLLDKLGLPDPYYVAPPEKYELEMTALRKEARVRVIAFLNAPPENKASLREEAVQILREMEAQVRANDSLTRQKLMSEWVSLGTPEGPYTPAEERKKLMDALHVTAPHFDPKGIDDFRYTQEETELIYKIAGTYVEEGNHSAAIELYRQLLDYLQNHSLMLSRYPGQITIVAFGYARELVLEEQYAEARQIAEIGRQACVKYDRHQYHPQLLAILAVCCAKLGDQEESKKNYYRAYYLYEAFEDWDNLENLRKDAMDTLGLDLV